MAALEMLESQVGKGDKSQLILGFQACTTLAFWELGWLSSSQLPSVHSWDSKAHGDRP